MYHNVPQQYLMTSWRYLTLTILMATLDFLSLTAKVMNIEI